MNALISTLTSGLTGFEIVLMFLGIVLFLVALFGLILQIKDGKLSGKLVVYFFLAIAMIGYAKLKSVQIGNLVLTISSDTEQLAKAANDPSRQQEIPRLREQIQMNLNKIGARTFSDPQQLTDLAKAQYALGQESTAEQNLQKALARNPGFRPATQLNEQITKVNLIGNLASQVEAHPQDQASRSELAKTLEQVNTTNMVNPNALATIAAAHNAAGDPAKAVETANKAITVAPQSPKVPQLEALKNRAQMKLSPNLAHP